MIYRYLTPFLIICVFMPASGKQKGREGDSEIIDKAIAKLAPDIGNKDKRAQLLYSTLLLQKREFARVIKFYENQTKEKGDLYLQMAYLQALIAQKRYDDVIRILKTIGDGHEIRAIQARRFFFAAQDAPDRDVKLNFLNGAVDMDPTFELPYYYLSKMALDKSEALNWAARGLSVVQPDTDFAEKSRQVILENLK